MFGKFLSKEDKSEAAELDKQEVIQECATMLENNEQECISSILFFLLMIHSWRTSKWLSFPSEQERRDPPYSERSFRKEGNTRKRNTTQNVLYISILYILIRDRPLPKTKEDVYLCLKKELDEDVLGTLMSILH